MQIRITDHSPNILAQMQRNVRKLMTAWGQEGVGLTVEQMESGYGKPIRDTGNLIRDVSYAVENSGPDSVDIGNTLEYGPYVHDGTRKMAGRPYLRDGLISGADRLKKTAEEILPEGME